MIQNQKVPGPDADDDFIFWAPDVSEEDRKSTTEEFQLAGFKHFQRHENGNFKELNTGINKIKSKKDINDSEMLLD